MATIDYARFQTRAESLLAKYGREMQIVNYEKDHDPIQGGNTVAITQTATIYGVELPASEGMRQMFQHKFSEELIRDVTSFLLLSAKGVGFPIRAGSLLYKGVSDTYHEVPGATPLQPDGETTILYWAIAKLSSFKVAELDGLSWNTLNELNTAVEEMIEPRDALSELNTTVEEQIALLDILKDLNTAIEEMIVL